MRKVIRPIGTVDNIHGLIPMLGQRSQTALESRGSSAWGGQLDTLLLPPLQVNNDNFDLVRSTGGCGEFYLHREEALHPHFGYGIDDSLDSTVTTQLTAARINRNQFFCGNLICDVTKNLRLGFKVSHWDISNVNVTFLDVDNCARMFHTRVRLKF